MAKTTLKPCPTYKCVYCGAEKQRKRNSAGKYCSVQCQHKHTHDKKYQRWLAGHIEANPSFLRKAVHRRDGGVCAVCGLSAWMGKRLVLEIEHKDGNSDNNAHNNLSLLCPNCHSQTSTYKGKNRGNGRHFRRVRRAQGKSF